MSIASIARSVCFATRSNNTAIQSIKSSAAFSADDFEEDEDEDFAFVDCFLEVLLDGLDGLDGLFLELNLPLPLENAVPPTKAFPLPSILPLFLSVSL